ncbi:ABC transporter ATP-binding protein [Actinocorallia populi]|uniref:ABC transporter ATP-binding protein n=1 Tax=Actinocorallia populi TaxID=2079200 RepID=UPI001E5C06AA|nr:ATP-binding cassette domain-containing protein [Actinocorallia populi]
MGLTARLGVRRDGFRVDVEFEVGAGEIVGLLGPNGAGKTTVLRALAGLVRLEEGRIELDGERLERLPAEERPVGMVFQDYLLFPHLSVVENVAFGPRCGGTPAREARRAAAGWLERVGMGGHGKARPRELSGGQAQRVALARALAVEPKLLLLDEPLAALDARTRLEVRSGLRRHLADFAGAALLVTHDPLDAMVLCDRLIVIEAGRIVQEGTPAEVARRPRTDYVARLVGLNLYRGTGHGRRVTLTGTAPPGVMPDGTTPDGTAPGGDMTSSDGTTGCGGTAPGNGTADRDGVPPDGDTTSSGGTAPGDGTADCDGVPSGGAGDGLELDVAEETEGPVFVAFPPAAVALRRERPGGVPGNLWRSVVEGVEQQGDRVRIQLDGPLRVLADVPPAEVAELAPDPGAEVWVSVQSTEIRTYPV